MRQKHDKFNKYPRIKVKNLSQCIEVDGRYYCWDFANKRFVELTFTPIHISQVPEKVIIAFMNAAYGKKEARNEP